MNKNRLAGGLFTSCSRPFPIKMAPDAKEKVSEKDQCWSEYPEVKENDRDTDDEDKGIDPRVGVPVDVFETGKADGTNHQIGDEKHEKGEKNSPPFQLISIQDQGKGGDDSGGCRCGKPHKIAAPAILGSIVNLEEAQDIEAGQPNPGTEEKDETDQPTDLAEKSEILSR